MFGLRWRLIAVVGVRGVGGVVWVVRSGTGRRICVWSCISGVSGRRPGVTAWSGSVAAVPDLPKPVAYDLDGGPHQALDGQHVTVVWNAEFARATVRTMSAGRGRVCDGATLPHAARVLRELAAELVHAAEHLERGG